MRKISRRATQLAALVAPLTLALGGVAYAESNIINQNISGFNLPGVQLSHNSDEVRAADGTICRSAVGGSGAYMDVGVIGNPQNDDANANLSAYGRIVVPLGKQPSRVDCSRLYDLEIARHEIELKLSQMGLAQGIAPVTEAGFSSSNAGSAGKRYDGSGPAWIEEGWTRDGLKAK